jgi:Domain of unknown function (DUF5010)
MMKRLALAAIGLVLMASVPATSPPVLNAGKYGATFYWWYDHLPSTTLYRPTVAWDANDVTWWTNVVSQARDAGLGWVAPVSWGSGSNADPVTLSPLVSAIDRVAPGLKVALFDDTTSEVLRKNLARGRGWTFDVAFDLADLDGNSEGGLKYFYDQQWKPYFQTIPARQRLTVDGRPVVFNWISGTAWYTHTNFFHALIDALRAATRRDFGVDPFVIVENSWYELDPASPVDGLYKWFDPPAIFATSMTFNGLRVGHVVPGYECDSCAPVSRVIGRQQGATYRAGLQAAAPGADLVLIEGFTNVDENAHLIETATWGRLYLAITKWFSSNIP